MNATTDTNRFNISPKSVAKYSLLPGLLPRLKRLVDHLSQFMFFFTQIFGAVGLIDANHPCLRPENIGLYRFRDIMGMAAGNVVFDRKHIPQIVMFFAVVLAITLSVCLAIVGILLLAFKVNGAHAQFFGTPQSLPGGGGSGSVTYNAETDWALLFLSRIFGEVGQSGQGMFPPAVGGNPWFLAILVGMLKYYSLAILLVAAFMIMYLLLITVVDSAKSGRPFGTRFDSAWTPIRLALAIGLLVPIASGGYNGAQLITFQAAKWGSNLATNVWYGGISTATQNNDKFFSTMLADPGYRFVRDMFLINLCVQAIEDANKEKAVFSGVVTDGMITYTFGSEAAPDFCGQVTYLSAKDIVAPSGVATAAVNGTPKVFTQMVVDRYVDIMKDFLPVEDSKILDGRGLNFVDGRVKISESVMGSMSTYMSGQILGTQNQENENFGAIAAAHPGNPYSSDDIMTWINRYRSFLGYDYTTQRFFADATFKPLIQNYETWLINSLRQDAKYGWTSAGVFYMRMSTAISGLSAVTEHPPTVSQLPSNLTKSFATSDNPTANTDQIEANCSSWTHLWGMWTTKLCAKYKLAQQMNTYFNGGKDWFLASVQKDKVAYQAVQGQRFDRALELGEPDSSTNANSGVVMSPILQQLTTLSQLSSSGMNPLGAIIVWGNTLINISSILLVIAMVAGSVGIGKIALSLCAMCFFFGFVLAFWVPLVPFLYFMFAVIEWMVSILEAVIGMPLFALSLITLEGGPLGGGMSGFKRLFEIVLRPTIIVMSLIASIIIFGASIRFLNDAMGLYRGAADGAMFSSAIFGIGMTIMYVFIIYTLATSCFKLIDQIPDNFFRWLDPSIRGFSASTKFGTSGIGHIGGYLAAGAGLSAVTGGVGNVTQAGKSGINKIKSARAANKVK